MNAPAKKKLAPKNATPPAASKANTLSLLSVPDESDDNVKAKAEFALHPVINNAATAMAFSRGTFGENDLIATAYVMLEKVDQVLHGNMSEVEATLTAQAASLDAIFTELARRAALNMGEHLPATEIYLRHAFKAQAQCRSTLEALAEIKNPRPVAFVKQANISNGHQQVNNGALPAHGNNSIQSNELLGAGNELLANTRESSFTSRVNQEVEAVGAIHRPQD